jgi:hypothetical protein
VGEQNNADRLMRLLIDFAHDEAKPANVRLDAFLTLGGVNCSSPTGHTYTTKPGGAVLFPVFAVPTGTLVLPTSAPPGNGKRGLMMPTRGRTRTADRAARNDWERGINEARIAAEAAREAARRAACHDPPPF